MRALANAYETTRVPGVAFAEWGPADMSMSHGFRTTSAGLARPELRAARQRVLDACQAAGIFFLDGATTETLQERLQEGVRIFAGTEPLKQLAESMT